MEMDPNLQKLRQSKERMPYYREVLDLAEMLFLERSWRQPRESTAAWPMDPAKIKRRMAEGIPYLFPADAPLDFSQAEKYLSCLLHSLEKINPARFRSLREGMQANHFKLASFWNRLLRNQLTGPAMQEEFGPEGSLMLFLLVQTLKVCLETPAERWRSALDELSWTQGYCPFCGGVPGMGEIRQEGKRLLHCSLCQLEWEYPRMKCPYCRNEDPARLTYFQVEGETENRVDVCLVCRHYLKTIDSREKEGTRQFDVEDYLTLHLDYLAQEEGYLPPSKVFMEFAGNLTCP